VLAGLSLAATVGLLACAIATGLRSARAAGQLRA